MIEIPANVPDDERRPYAPAANVLGLLDRIRRRNLPDAVDADFMRIAAIPEASMTRVAATLRFLGLTDEAARPTDRLRAMARADDDEFREMLAAVLREAYAPDFARVDPAEDTQARIVSAFQRYQPRSQTERMVMLFLGLVRAAGMAVLEAPRERQMRTPARQPGRIPARQPNRVAGRTGSVTVRDQLAVPAPSRSPLTFDLAQLVLIESDADYNEAWAAIGKAQRIIGKAQRAANDRAAQADAAAAEAEDGQEGEEGE